MYLLSMERERVRPRERKRDRDIETKQEERQNIDKNANKIQTIFYSIIELIHLLVSQFSALFLCLFLGLLPLRFPGLVN